MDLAAVDELARRQHGLITYAQLLAVGYSSATISRMRARGTIVLVGRGVYRVVGAPLTWRQRVMAATLSAAPNAYASHRTASALHQLHRARGGIIEVTSEHSQQHQRSSTLADRTYDLPAVDRSIVDGIPVTSVNRTLIDVGRYWGHTRVGSMLDHAVRDGLTTHKAFEARVHDLGRQGRNGIGTARLVLRNRGLDGTWGFEKAMRKALHDFGLPKPVRELRVDVGLNRYYLDFAYPEANLGIECDSTRWHTLPSQVAADLDRQNKINGAGFLLLRYASSQLRDDREGVVAEIRHHLLTRTRPSDSVSVVLPSGS